MEEWHQKSRRFVKSWQHGGSLWSVLVRLNAAPSGIAAVVWRFNSVSIGVLPACTALLAGLIALRAPAALAQPLQCRLADGPWQPCTIRVEAPADKLFLRWTIELGARRIDFRHDGSGTVQMLASAGWIAVETSWIAGPALCWNGLCARGDIPLD